MLLRQAYYLRYCLKTQEKSGDGLRSFQNRLFSQLIEHAYSEFPIYQEIWDRLDKDLKESSIDEIEEFPFLQSRSELKSQAQEFEEENYLLSSGSSGGGRTRIDFDQAAWEWGEAVYLRGFLNECFSFGQEQSYYWYEEFDRGFLKNLVLPKNLIHKDWPLDKQLEKLEEYSSSCMVYFPHVLHTLAKKKIASETEFDISPEMIVTHGNILTDSMRETISDAFDCENIFDHYGCTEMNRIAWECPEGGLHINEDSVFVEILDEDDEEVNEGEKGRMVVTGLYNEKAPFIRYELNDYVVKGRQDPRCGCKTDFAKIRKVLGREKDIITTEDGKVYPEEVADVLASYESLLRFQMTREDGNMKVKYIPNDNFTEEVIEDAKESLERYGLKPDFEEVESLGMTPGGKYLPVNL